MAAKKKIAQTVITEGKYYTINAANGKVVEVADYNIENGAKIQLWTTPMPSGSSGASLPQATASTACRTVSPAR
ncbi:MAG: hypothetical protein EP147_18880 [Subdoligranulum sp.]|nr:hypothetical protein [Subdoligranulum sp.]